MPNINNEPWFHYFCPKWRFWHAKWRNSGSISASFRKNLGFVDLLGHHDWSDEFSDYSLFRTGFGQFVDRFLRLGSIFSLLFRVANNSSGCTLFGVSILGILIVFTFQGIWALWNRCFRGFLKRVMCAVLRMKHETNSWFWPKMSQKDPFLGQWRAAKAFFCA